MNIEQQTRVRGWTEVIGGMAGAFGGIALGLATVAVEIAKFSEAQAYSAMTRLNLTPELEAVTVPALAGSVGLVAAGVILVGAGSSNLRYAELIREIDSIPTESV